MYTYIYPKGLKYNKSGGEKKKKNEQQIYSFIITTYFKRDFYEELQGINKLQAQGASSLSFIRFKEKFLL